MKVHYIAIARLLSLVLIVCCYILPTSATLVSAQSDEWQEFASQYFRILYVGADRQVAENYASFADPLYTEMSTTFGHQIATPIILRLYPTLDYYYDLNPMARGMNGIVAHADFRRNEVAVIISQTTEQSDQDIQNNVRHELTHMFVADLSENRINAGFQEGIAQFLETVPADLQPKLNALRTAVLEQRLLPWSAFDQRDAVYQNVQISYPQSLSVVTFLAQRNGFSTLREFIATSASSSGYRSALERTYGTSPDKLEAEWLDWLPGYLSGHVSTSAPVLSDSSHAESLFQAGNYAAAEQEASTVIEALRQQGDQQKLADAEALLVRIRQSIQAEQLAHSAYEALSIYDYQQAQPLIAQAQELFAAAQDTRQSAILADYANRAERGIQADQALKSARDYARSLRYPQARTLTDQALSDYLALRDQTRVNEAQQLRSFLDQRQSLLGGVLLLLGMGGIAMGITRRTMVQEAEAW